VEQAAATTSKQIAIDVPLIEADANTTTIARDHESSSCRRIARHAHVRVQSARQPSVNENVAIVEHDDRLAPRLATPHDGRRRAA
jgi:hypothetical protein